MAEIHKSEYLTIGTTPVVVSVERGNNNGIRENILILNSSTGGQKITLGFDKPAVDNEGVLLHAGGFYADSRDGTGYLPTQKLITAVSDGADGKLSVQERVFIGVR